MILQSLCSHSGMSASVKQAFPFREVRHFYLSRDCLDHCLTMTNACPLGIGFDEGRPQRLTVTHTCPSYQGPIRAVGFVSMRYLESRTEKNMNSITSSPLDAEPYEFPSDQSTEKAHEDRYTETECEN